MISDYDDSDHYDKWLADCDSGNACYHCMATGLMREVSGALGPVLQCTACGTCALDHKEIAA